MSSTESDNIAEPSVNRVKVAHLVIGLFFLGFVALATGLDTGTLAWHSARYLWPALLVTAGVIGLAASYATSRRRGLGH